MKLRNVWVLTATLHVAMSACAPEESLPHFGTLQYESDNFEVWASDGLRACGGTFSYAETWLDSFRQRTGMEGSGPHTFYWASPEDFERFGGCGEDSSACAFENDRVAYSTLIPMEHEVVHLELAASRPPPLFSEGAAEMFGSIRSSFGADAVDVEPQLTSPAGSDAEYASAGRFSRFIVDRYGLETYFEAYDRLHGADGFEDTDIAVQEVLGVELSSLFDEFDAYPTCPIARWRFYDTECSDANLVLWTDPSLWSANVRLDCSAPDVMGPRGGLTWTHRAVDIPVAQRYRLDVESDDETVQVTLLRCGGDCYTGPAPDSFATTDRIFASPTSTGASAPLEAGRYWMRIAHAEGPGAAVTVRLVPD